MTISAPSCGDRQGQAGGGATAVEQHGAGSALAVVAALLGSGDAEVLAQQVEQGDAVVDGDVSFGAVDAQGDIGEVG